MDKCTLSLPAATVLPFAFRRVIPLYPEKGADRLEAKELPFSSRSGGVRRLLAVEVADVEGLGWLADVVYAPARLLLLLP